MSQDRMQKTQEKHLSGCKDRPRPPWCLMMHSESREYKSSNQGSEID